MFLEQLRQPASDILPAVSHTASAQPTVLSWMRDEGTLKLDVNWATPGVVEWRAEKAPSKGGISGLDKVIGAALTSMTADYVNDGTTVTLPGAAPSVTLANLLTTSPAEHDVGLYVALTGNSSIFEPHLW